MHSEETTLMVNSHISKLIWRSNSRFLWASAASIVKPFEEVKRRFTLASELFIRLFTDGELYSSKSESVPIESLPSLEFYN